LPAAFSGKTAKAGEEKLIFDKTIERLFPFPPCGFAENMEKSMSKIF